MSAESPSMKQRLKAPAFIITAVFMIAGISGLAIQSSPPSGALFFAPFALGPLFFSIVFAVWFHRQSCQILLMAGSIFYAAWFTWGYLNVFHWNPDAQGAIMLLFVGVYSLPVMIPIWIAALAMHFRSRAKRSGGDSFASFV